MGLSQVLGRLCAFRWNRQQLSLMIMKKMKAINLSLIVLLLLPAYGRSQGFMSKDMETYCTLCVKARNNIQEEKCDELLTCALEMSKLNISELELVSLQPNEERSLDGHVVFTDSGLIVVAEAIINKNSIRYNLHNTNRGNEVLLAHRVIPADTTMVYQMTCVELVDLLVFPEQKGSFDVSAKNGQGKQISQGGTDTGWCLLHFDVGDMPDTVTISITNKEKYDICCAIAVNGQ